MNRPHHRQVLECASPLALATTHDFQSARGLAHSKTLPRFILSQSGTAVQGFKVQNYIRRILTLTRRFVAQVSKPAVSPISKSAVRATSCALRVWKPAIQQTWKSALQFRGATRESFR